MGTDLERLRRRLYAAGAAPGDVTAYRAALVGTALVAEPSPVVAVVPAAARSRPPRPHRSRPAVLAAALAVAVAAVGLVAATGAVDPRRAARSPEQPIRPAVRLTSSPQGLTSRVDVQRLIDRAFAQPSGAAQGVLTDRIRAAALPDATASTELAEAGGRSDREGAVVDLGPGGVEVGTGDVLLLSVVTREPASSTWRVLGWRGGEPHVPHVVVEVQPQGGGADRIAVGVVRAPESMTVTSLAVQVTPGTPSVHRVEVHDVAVCAPVTGPACVSGWRAVRG